jgi:WD40 repeat protein
LDVSKDGKVAFVGSEKGVMRVFDLSNRTMPRLIKSYRFYENQVSINNVRCSNDGKYVIITSQDSETMYIVSQDVEHEFEVYGHVVFEGYISNACFAIHDSELKALAVLTNTTLAGISMPTKIGENRMEPIADSITKPVYRKVDRGLNIVMSNIYNGDIYLCGEDRLLKKYEFPTEAFAKLDFKKPPAAPLD